MSNNNKRVTTILRWIGSELDKLDVPQESRSIELSEDEMSELVSHLVEQNVIEFSEEEWLQYLQDSTNFLAEHFSGLQGYGLNITLNLEGKDAA